MSKPGNILYTPKDGFRARTGLNIYCESLDQFEYRWNGSGDYGDFWIRKVEIRSGFEIWITECLVHKEIRFSIDDHPPIFSFSFCLSGKSTAFYSSKKQPFEISTGKQGVFYSPIIKGTSCLSANIPIRQIGIVISPERLCSYLEFDQGSIHPDLLKILEKKHDDLFCHMYTITPAMRLALEQLFNCPFCGMTRKLFFESRALELISYQLDQMSNSQSQDIIGRQYLHPGDRKRIERVKDYLIENLENPPVLNQLAREAGMSHPKLNRCFRQMYGVTVFEYLRNERLTRAREMLSQGLNVTETAYSVGYESISHFSQAFKKQFNTSPSSFIARRNQRGIYR